jgi:hypothetical protein
MKLNSIKKFPFYPFLLPAFFVLHVINHYFGLIPVQTILAYFLYYVLLAALFLFTGWLLFKTLIKAGIWATALLIPFFFFGALHDFLKTTSFTHIISSYTFLLPFLSICLLIFSLYCKKKKVNFDKAHKYFTTLFVLLVCIELIGLLLKTISPGQKNNLAYNNKEIIQPIATCDTCSKPDIFFIVFDEYASSLSLKKYLGFENNRLDSSLQRNNFYIAKNAKSNYNSTPLSIGSTLNLQYFNLPLENEVTTAPSMLQGWSSLKNSRLPHLLAQSGYAIHNFGLCDFNNYPVHTSRYFTNYERRALYEETLWGRIKRDIIWNVGKLQLAFLTKGQAQQLEQLQTAFIERNRKNWQLVLQELKTQNDQPKFIFGHIMMPHTPFYIDKNGNRTKTFSPIYSTKNSAAPYLEQLIYTNTWIDSILQATNRDWKRPRVVIVEGDHGFRDLPFQPELRDKQFMNLNTYYFSDKDYSMLYDSISPVNSFRVVLNKYFKTKLPLLKDSTIFLK